MRQEGFYLIPPRESLPVYRSTATVPFQVYLHSSLLRSVTPQALNSAPSKQMHPITYAIGAVLIVAWAAFTAYNLWQGAKRKAVQCPPLPGPRLVPFIGRIHDLPIQYMWLKFKEWSDIYGPIYYTEMLGAKFVIISDEDIAEELLVKRAKFNSDRPPMRSVTDSKSTEGGMEYLPLMGKNSE